MYPFTTTRRSFTPGTVMTEATTGHHDDGDVNSYPQNARGVQHRHGRATLLLLQRWACCAAHPTTPRRGVHGRVSGGSLGSRSRPRGRVRLWASCLCEEELGRNREPRRGCSVVCPDAWALRRVRRTTATWRCPVASRWELHVASHSTTHVTPQNTLARLRLGNHSPSSASA